MKWIDDILEWHHRGPFRQLTGFFANFEIWGRSSNATPTTVWYDAEE